MNKTGAGSASNIVRLGRIADETEMVKPSNQGLFPQWFHVQLFTAAQLTIFNAFMLSAGAWRSRFHDAAKLWVLVLISSYLDVSSFAPWERARSVASARQPLTATGRRWASSLPQLSHRRLGLHEKDDVRGPVPGFRTPSQVRCRTSLPLRHAGCAWEPPPGGNS